jgi:recombination protein RecT
MANANGGNTALMEKAKNGGKLSQRAALKNVLTKFQSEISAALPTHLKKNAERYARQMLTLFSSNKNLQKCSQESILGALMTASALGLDLSPQLGQCYIIPYKGQAQFQLGYKGGIDLAYRSGRIKRIFAEVVKEKDHFEYSKGLNAVLEHEEANEADPGQPVFVYALAEFTNGGYAFDVWPWEKVIAHGKKFSQSYHREGSPWKTDPEAMAKKTLLKAIWKYLPISTDIQYAEAMDGAVRSITKDDEIQDEHEIFDITPDYGSDEGEAEPGNQNAAPLELSGETTKKETA